VTLTTDGAPARASDLDLGGLVAYALGSYGNGRLFTQPPAGQVVTPATRFMDADRLRASIVRAVSGASVDGGEQDLRPAASRWTRQYAAAVLPGILVGLAAGIGVDASIDRCAIVERNHLPAGLLLDSDAPGTLVWPWRPGTTWVNARLAQSRAELRERVLNSLFAHHLLPLFERVLDVAKLSPDVLWSNVAEHADLVYEAARLRLDSLELQPFEEDAASLLDGPDLPGVAGPNPLRGWIERDPVDEPDFPRPMQLRRICCLHYLIPDRIGRLCSNCPLATREQRVSTARSARGGHSIATVAVQAGGPVTSIGSTLPPIGAPAPDFSLHATGGRTVSLAEYRDKQAVVVFFYVADDGVACTAEALSFRERMADFEAQGVAIIGISTESVESHEQFAATYDLPFPLLADTDHAVAERYGVWQRTLLRSREIAGIIRTTFVVGVDGTIQAVFTDVRGGRHADHVLAVCAGLGERPTDQRAPGPARDAHRSSV